VYWGMEKYCAGKSIKGRRVLSIFPAIISCVGPCAGIATGDT